MFKFVFANPFEEIIELLEAMRRLQHQARARVLRPRARGLAGAAGRHGPAGGAAARGLRDGRASAACPPTARNLAAMADNMPEGKHHWGVIGIGRDQWMLVAAALTLGGSIRVGLEDNFYLPDGTMARSNGDLIAKARQLTEDARPAPGHRRGGPGAAGDRPAARGGHRGVSGLPLEDVRVLDLSRLLPGGFCSLLLADFGADVIKVEDTGIGDYVRWSPPHYEGADRTRLERAVPGAQPGQALDPDRPQDRRGQAGAAWRWCATPTCCSSRSGPGCSTASGSATSGCARRTRGSSTARSAATARTAPTATARATT